MFFHPANTPRGALEAIWVPVHIAWFFAYLLIICSFVFLYQSLIASQTAFTKLGYWLSFLGTVLSLPIAVWDSFVIPYLAKHAPDFILQIEEVSMETPVLIFRIIVFLTILIFSLGFLLYGISVMQMRIAPKMAGAGLAVGAPLFWIGALFFSKGMLGNLITEIGAVLFGLGLLILGIHLVSNPLPLVRSLGNESIKAAL
ncbi:MAG: hypothetical protein KME16_24230 [Scytolyngbya sp. HA4215-MV1]|nr:hypothetical protein [Scytolyngbya sp. HA4215-MV1]